MNACLVSFLCVSLLCAACTSDPDPVDPDAGRVDVDASATDAGGGAPDAWVRSCRAVATERGWDVCRDEGARCELVFDDATGCSEACAAIGRTCVASYDDVLGECRAQDTSLGCSDTGHMTDYCVCDLAPVDAGVPEDAGPLPDGGPMPDAGPRPDAGDAPPHEAILDERVGFGRFTTGGAGGPVVEVTTLADSGPGSLRAAAEADGAAWIRFRVDGVIDLSSPIQVRSDKTVDGRGADVTVTGHGLFVQGGHGNVILTHFGIRDTDNDLIRFYDGGANMWVHHMDLENGGDGAFDATEGVTGVTVSHTHIRNHDKAMLVGAGSDDGDGASMRWTGHHNWYEDCVQRLPFIRMGWAHSFNNLIEWRSGTAMSVRIGDSQMLVEGNILAPQTGVGHKVISEGSGRGAARFVGNLERPLSGDEIEFTEHLPETVFDAHDEYPYVAETANDELIARIRETAGVLDLPFPE